MPRHIIFILDIRKFDDPNISFLTYIENIMPKIKDMGVTINFESVNAEDLKTNVKLIQFLKTHNITSFPILITETSVRYGYKEVRSIYEKNIASYNEFLAQAQARQQQRKKRVDPELEPRKRKNGQFGIEDSDSDSAISDDMFGEDKDDMMNSYRQMMDNRKPQKKPGPSRPAAIEETTSKSQEKFKKVKKQILDDSDDEEGEYKKDNVVDESTPNINIDTTKIHYESDGDDPEDRKLEEAYWLKNGSSI